MTIALAACGGDHSTTFDDSTSDLGFRYPRSWSVAGFSQTTFPQRVVVASYEVSKHQVEGDCGGTRALQALPSDGAAVLLIDYGATSTFAPHPGDFRLAEFEFAAYECFGETYMVRFHRNARDLQAFVAVGPRATADRRREALAILDSIHAP